MIQFNINSDSPVPAYQQVIKSIKLEILSGELREGARLPSIRDLASILKLNPNTVARAYYNLRKERFIECKGRRGSLVKYKKTRIGTLRKTIAKEEFRCFLEKAFSLGISKDELKKIIERYFERNIS